MDKEIIYQRLSEEEKRAVLHLLPTAVAAIAKKAIAGDVKAFNALYDLEKIRREASIERIFRLMNQGKHEEARKQILIDLAYGYIDHEDKSRLLDLLFEPDILRRADVASLPQLARAYRIIDELIQRKDVLAFKAAAQRIAANIESAASDIIKDEIGWGAMTRILRDGLTFEEMAACLGLENTHFITLACLNIEDDVRGIVIARSIAKRLANGQDVALQVEERGNATTSVVVENITKTNG